MLPCGTTNRSYEEDTAIFRTRAQWLLLLAFFVVLFLIPQWASDPILNMLIFMGIILIGVLGLNILTGYCGQFNLGQAAFIGVGAYASAILTSKVGFSFWLALPCAAGITALVGALFGLPALRLKGFYLAVSTLAAQFILIYIMSHGGNLTGGMYGLKVSPPSLGSFVFASKESWFYLTMLITIIMVFFAVNIARTKVGKAFIAIRDNDRAAQVMGVNLFYYKMLAFIICGAYAGVSGALWAHFTSIAHYHQFPLLNSIWYLGMLIVGGMGTVMGAIFGVIFLKSLDESVAVVAPLVSKLWPALGADLFASGAMMVYALVILVFLIFEPRGINHRWLLFKNSYRLFPFAY